MIAGSNIFAVISELSLASLLLQLCFAHSAHGACSNTAGKGNPSAGSGTIQLVDIRSECRPSSFLNLNSMFALCGESFKVVIDKKGVVMLTPSSTTVSYKYNGPGPLTGSFTCRQLGATGIAVGKAPTSASVTFFSDVNARTPSSLKIISSSNSLLNLTFTNTFQPSSARFQCWLKYKVTSGCVLGVRAPAKPYACPPGTIIKRGRFGNYCTLCPPGTTSTKANSRSCIPCRRGFENPLYGGSCTRCVRRGYASKPGTPFCKACSSDGKAGQFYTNGISCKRCPPDSWASDLDPSQCVACADGKKCCRAGAGPGCPACPKGFKSGKNATAILAFVTALPPKCAINDAARCSTTIRISVDKTCRIYTDSSSPLDALTNNKVCNNGNPGMQGTTMKGRKPQLSDIQPFLFYVGRSQPATLTSKLLTFPLKTNLQTIQVRVKGACKYTYRILSVSSPNPFPFTPTPCSAGGHGCVTKTKPPTCGPGQYVRGAACLPCPPGQYNPGKGSSTSCTLCPAGTSALGYANTKCQ